MYHRATLCVRKHPKNVNMLHLGKHISVSNSGHAPNNANFSKILRQLKQVS